MAALMARFRVGTRIYAGFATVLVLMALTAVIGIRGLGGSAASFDTYESASNAAVNITLIDRQIVGLRRNILLYTGSEGDEKAMDRIRTLQKELGPALEAAIAAADTPERRSALERLRASYQAYGANVEKMITLRQKRDKLVNENLLAAGHKIRQSIDTLTEQAMAAQDYRIAALAGEVQQTLMQSRLDSWRYLATPDAASRDKTVKQIAAGMAEATHLAAEAGRPQWKALAEQAAAAAGEYGKAFAETAAATDESNTLITVTMADQATEIAKLAEDLRSDQIKGMQAEKSLARGSMDAARSTATTIAVIAGLGGLILAWLIASGIVGPVRAMTQAMSVLASGDKAVAIPALENRDELGDMARAVEVFKHNAIEMDRLQSEQEEHQRRAEEEKRRSMNALADGFQAEVAGVVNTVSSAATEMEATAQAMAGAADQASRQATIVSAASEQASASVQTVAAAAEQLSSSITEIARQVAHSAEIAGQGADAAKRTDAVVQGLADAANRIGEVVALISDIASQTNLLALNATIEAARAGEAGKGFAVVANEVKSLANQTAKATDDISAQVAGIQNAATDAVNAIRDIGSVITRINEIASTVASAVEEQGAATQEIARNTQQAASGTEEVSRNIVGVTQASGETGQAASQVLSAAGQLSREAEMLRSKVEGFIAQVRSA
jgi:methyl-accepting chemotaxis protein